MIRSGTAGCMLAAAIGAALSTPLPADAATRTEKTFGSWVAVCVESDGQAKRCSIAHQLISKTTRQPVFTLTLTAAGGEAGHNVMIAIQTGVSLRDGITLVIGDRPPVALTFEVCGPRACTATGVLDPELAGVLQAEATVLANYVLANRKLVQVKVDLAGFADAYAFMTSQVP